MEEKGLHISLFREIDVQISFNSVIYSQIVIKVCMLHLTSKLSTGWISQIRNWSFMMMLPAYLDLEPIFINGTIHQRHYLWRISQMSLKGNAIFFFLSYKFKFIILISTSSYAVYVITRPFN